MVILAVIFPKAHFADFVTTAPMKGLVATAWATVGLLALLRLGHVFKHTRSLHQPTRKVLINALTGEVSTKIQLSDSNQAVARSEVAQDGILAMRVPLRRGHLECDSNLW
jgi:hypothetical protein